MPDILTTHALIDDVLDTFRDVLGPTLSATETTCTAV